MPRLARDFRAVHAEADRFEPRLARALQKALLKLRGRVSVDALAAALKAGNVRRAVAVLSRAAVEDALSPVAQIKRDAFVRGGKLGAAAVNKATGAR